MSVLKDMSALILNAIANLRACLELEFLIAAVFSGIQTSVPVLFKVVFENFVECSLPYVYFYAFISLIVQSLSCEQCVEFTSFKLWKPLVKQFDEESSELN